MYASNNYARPTFDHRLIMQIRKQQRKKGEETGITLYPLDLFRSESAMKAQKKSEALF